MRHAAVGRDEFSWKMPPFAAGFGQFPPYALVGKRVNWAKSLIGRRFSQNTIWNLKRSDPCAERWKVLLLRCKKLAKEMHGGAVLMWWAHHFRRPQEACKGAHAKEEHLQTSFGLVMIRDSQHGHQILQWKW
jgi:hypothetical protein